MKLEQGLFRLWIVNNFIKNLPVVIHQIFFLTAQLLILYMYGIGYSGSLAYIGAVSTILAVLINLKWDIEILVSNHQRLSDSLLDASVTIIIMTILISILNILIGDFLPLHILFSAIAIGIHELLVSILFVQRKILTYSFFRTIPALALFCFALIGFEPEVVWPASFFLSAIFLVLYFRNLFSKVLCDLNVSRIKNIRFINNINAAITATIFAVFSASFVIIINFYHGSEYVGLWANTMRIFNSIIFFLLAACLPFVLNMLKDRELAFEKVKIFFYLWLIFLPIIIVSFFIVSNWGLFIFSFIQPVDFEITNTHLSLIFLVGMGISFIGSTQGLYQAINKSVILFIMIIITLILGLFFINISTLSFTGLIQTFSFVVLFFFCIISMHLIYHLIFKIR